MNPFSMYENGQSIVCARGWPQARASRRREALAWRDRVAVPQLPPVRRERPPHPQMLQQTLFIVGEFESTLAETYLPDTRRRALQLGYRGAQTSDAEDLPAPQIELGERGYEPQHLTCFLTRFGDVQ